MALIGILDRSSQKATLWLGDSMRELDWTSPQRSYLALRAVLHALRDRLMIEEVAQFGAQLPVFIRGIYYEGWNPSLTPVKDRRKKAFLEQIKKDFARSRNPMVDPEHIARAIFRVLEKNLSHGELDQVRHLLTHDLRKLWPESKAA